MQYLEHNIHTYTHTHTHTTNCSRSGIATNALICIVFFFHFFHSYKFGSQLSQIKSLKYTLILTLILTLNLNLNHDHNPYNFIVNCYFSSKILYAQHSWIFMSVWLYSFVCECGCIQNPGFRIQPHACGWMVKTHACGCIYTLPKTNSIQ